MLDNLRVLGVTQRHKYLLGWLSFLSGAAQHSEHVAFPNHLSTVHSAGMGSANKQGSSFQCLC